MTELKIHKHGADLAVWIGGDTEEEVERQFWSFWNHGATSGELAWDNDVHTSAHFWVTNTIKATSMEKLERAMVNICLFKILNANPDAGKGEKGGALPEARLMAQEWLEGIDKSWALSSDSKVIIETHKAELPIQYTDETNFERIRRQEVGGRWED